MTNRPTHKIAIPIGKALEIAERAREKIRKQENQQDYSDDTVYVAQWPAANGRQKLRGEGVTVFETNNKNDKLKEEDV